MPGFMTPAEAMEDAFQDLRASVGRCRRDEGRDGCAAEKFEPAGFARLLPVPTLMDKMNPARRKADMWDHFVEMFEDLSLESKDEFQTLFGKEFLAAYEREVERARHESPAL
jgi:FHA domain-containing protein